MDPITIPGFSGKWLPVTIPGYSHYSVSSKSEVLGPQGKILKPTRTGQVKLYNITPGKVAIHKSSHIISCLAFHGRKPSPEHTVDHINRDWENNSVDNLRWASKSLQVKNRKKFRQKGIQVVYKAPQKKQVFFKSIALAADHFGFKGKSLHYRLKSNGSVKVDGGFLEYDKLKPEKDSIIKIVPSWILEGSNDVFQASSCGLICNKVGLWTTGSTACRPAKYFRIGSRNSRMSDCSFRVHRLIAATFLGKANDPRQNYVNHIDGNGFNNRIENLEWASPSENTQHAVDTGLNPNVRPVVQYNLNGIRIGEFPSLKAAARSVNGSLNNISTTCTGITLSSYNFMWRYKSEAPEKLPPIIKNSVKKVRLYDLDGNLKTTFASRREAIRILGVSRYKITRCCQGKVNLGDFTLEMD